MTPSDPDASPRWRRLGNVAWLPALLCGALALRLAFFGGLLGWDDVTYWEAARALRAGDYAPHSTFHLRYMLTVPLALCQAWFGEHEWAPFLVPLAYSMAHLVLTYALGLLWGGVAVATAATALLAIVPLDVIAATDLHADLPLAVLLAATVYAVMRGEASTSRGRLWFLAAGVMLALAVATKEVALALAPFLAVRRALARRRPRGYGWAAIGFLGIAAAETIWLAALTGDPLYRYGGQAALHAGTVSAMAPGYGWMLGYPSMLLDPLGGAFGYFAGLFYLVVAATLWGLGRGRRAIEWLALWWGGLLLAFNFAPLDWTFSWPLFHHFARTLHPLLIPFVLASALWLQVGLAGRHVLRISVMVAVVGLAAVGILATHRDYRAWAAVARQAAPIIERLPSNARVITDPLTATQLKFLLPRSSPQIISYSEGEIGATRGPVFVLADPTYIAQGRREGLVPPDAMTTPPASWERVAELDRDQRVSLRGILRRSLGRDRGSTTETMRATLWRVVSP